MDRKGQYSVPLEARKDIAWCTRFIQDYNGVSLLWLVKEPSTDTVIQTDACLRGYGDICEEQYFRAQFPKRDQTHNIAIFEMWVVLVGLKIGAHLLTGKYFWVHVDNEAVATVLNTGSSRELARLTTGDSIHCSTKPVCAKNQIHTRGLKPGTRLVVQMA